MPVESRDLDVAALEYAAGLPTCFDLVPLGVGDAVVVVRAVGRTPGGLNGVKVKPYLAQARNPNNTLTRHQGPVIKAAKGRQKSAWPQ